MKTIEEIELKIKELLIEVESLKQKKPKFKVGKWYKNPRNKEIACVETEQCGFGFENNGTWRDSGTLFGFTSQGFIPATPQEVENALIVEAKKRGFKEGVKFKTFEGYLSPTHSIAEMRFIYSKDKDLLHIVAPRNEWEGGCSNPAIYTKGQWAEIIKEDKIMIGSYEVVCTEDNGFKIGCKNICRTEIIKIKEFMIDHRFTKVSFDGIEVSLETINKILSKL